MAYLNVPELHRGRIVLPEWLITTPLEAPRQGWGIRIDGKKIVEVAPNTVLRQRYPQDEVWEAPGQVLAPGFVDAHTHLYGVLAHGIPLDKAPAGFMPFLEDFWWPLVENRLDIEMICAATDLQTARMVQSGITSFYDCQEAPNALPGILNAQAKILEKRGLRGILSFEATQRVSEENGQLGLRENADFIEAYKNHPLLTGMMCFHTSFTCNADFICQAFDMAKQQDVLTHMHVSEGLYEPDFCLKRFDMRPMFYYDSLGVLGKGMLASQCVQISAEEIELMAARGVSVTHMPLSNCEVGGGIAPVPQLLAAGVTVGLGSDGYIHDFFEVMRGAFLIHKAAQLTPQVMPAHQVWHMATEGGAKALGLRQVGRLEPGWQADFQLIAFDLPTPLAEHNLYDQLLLYCHATDVTATVVAGKTLMRAGQVFNVNWTELKAKAHAAAQRLWAAS
jgi:cytosine/adenosine deaminase-related metal-dependent hydrolase